ncbi:MAG: hypothetical protein M1150_02470 [Patescibacteria group bacterium]|nr:hypothetical protein [Patescibacteria group bacterium]
MSLDNEASLIRYAPIMVDYTQTVKELLEKLEYDWCHPDISKVEEEIQEVAQEVLFYLIPFRKGTKDPQVITERLKSLQLRGAYLKELLVFGAAYKKERERGYIFAPGEMIENCFPFLPISDAVLTVSLLENRFLLAGNCYCLSVPLL